MANTADIVTAALKLPPHTRAFLATQLIESLDLIPGDELSPSWREEILKRCQSIDQEDVKLRDAKDVFADAYASLG